MSGKPLFVHPACSNAFRMNLSDRHVRAGRLAPKLVRRHWERAAADISDSLHSSLGYSLT